MQITQFIYLFSGNLGCFQFLQVKKVAMSILYHASMFTGARIFLGCILKVEWPGYKICVPSFVFDIVQLLPNCIVPINTLQNT